MKEVTDISPMEKTPSLSLLKPKRIPKMSNSRLVFSLPLLVRTRKGKAEIKRQGHSLRKAKMKPSTNKEELEDRKRSKVLIY